MTTEIPNSFVLQFEREVHHEFQQMGSKLRGTVFTKTGIVGESTSFPVIGSGTATTKTRHQRVNPANSTRDRVTCPLADAYYGEFADDLDLLKINHDERMAIARTAAMALGREIDQTIITAAGTTSLNIAADNRGLDLEKNKEAQTILGENEALDAGRNYVLVGWKQWSDLLDITQFASLDFVPPSELPFRGSGVQGKFWLGATYIPINNLPLAGTVRSCFRYSERALGHAIGKDITARMTEEGPEEAWWVSARMSQGACLIQEAGCVEILCEENIV